ncbi:MAG: hypothetical protein AAFV33_15450 [Chloroflexota bacterium]
MSTAQTYQNLYPENFEATNMDVPDAPNVEFSFVVKAPKEYVMDAWNLPRAHGGAIEPRTAGEADGDEYWPGIANNMERIIYVSGIPVTQVVGNVQTLEDGDWHFEWKAGAPYYDMPFPFPLIMKAVHGSATLSDGPGPDETTVTIKNRHNPGIALWFTRFAIKAAMPGLSDAAPGRFARKEFLGPQKNS